ncbi:hypothetical protein BJY00DRAFT_286367 [Aspergillus carlsbadensis]|nr:hypothetical protein BJY00DRAFT_286367 [Aspergillus carlsbadensis]
MFNNSDLHVVTHHTTYYYPGGAAASPSRDQGEYNNQPISNLNLTSPLTKDCITLPLTFMITLLDFKAGISGEGSTLSLR